MKAAQITHYKQEMPVITDVEIPTIKSTDVLVKIVAASINPIDLKTKDGGLKMLLKYKMPLTLGSDFSGIIVQIGSEVTDYKIGDAVYGRVEKNRIGTFAEYIATSASVVAPMPKNLTFEEAASIPLVGLTSYQALHDIMNIQSGEKVLIQAGSGGIGTIAIQIAKMFGAYVATTTSRKNFELVKSLGADLAIDYKTEDFTQILSDYDYVFDTQGGKILENDFKIIKPGGKVVSISGLPNERFADDYRDADGKKLPQWKKYAFKFVTKNLTKPEHESKAEYYFLFMRPDGEQLRTLATLLENGTLHPIIDRIIPFQNIDQAFEYSKSGRAKGKIILKMTNEFD